MIELNVYDLNGAETGKVSVDETVFGDRVNRKLLHEAVVLYEANRRVGTRSTKTRGEVSGSGKKPWRQKGTGRARAGCKRSPIWRKGGVALGPRPKDYRYTLPKKARRAALGSALLARLQEGAVKVVVNLELEQAKTKRVAGILAKLGLAGKVFIGIDGEDSPAGREKGHRAILAARNLPGIEIGYVSSLNARSLLIAPSLLLTRGALDFLVKSFEATRAAPAA